MAKGARGFSPVVRFWIVRLVIYLALILLLSGLIPFLPSDGLWLSLTALGAAGLAATVWLLLPLPRMALIAPAALVALIVALELSNRQKIEMTMFPITPTDLFMMATTPKSVLISVGAPDWAYWMLYLVPGHLLLAVLVAAIATLRRLGPRQGISAVCLLALSGVFAVGAMWGLYEAMLYRATAYLKANQTRLEVWEPAGISLLSTELGSLAFLTYAHDIERTDRNLFLTYDPGVAPPGRPQVLAAADVYIRQEAMADAPMPNIVILHAESTFDPNIAFRLDRQVINPLFPTSPNEIRPGSSHLAVPALVNTVGGGSWITEFEVITGIDSRLFGVAGRFTHSSLSPNAYATFPRYLAARGYQLAAYVFADGEFYNYRRAYLNYGFQEFYDVAFFKDGSKDLDIAETAMTTGTVATDAPFMKMILLNDNHSPHHCAAERVADYEPVAFQDQATTEMTCALQEYLWRSQSVARTADAIEARLIALKQATGRDYVLAIYGDHQPYSFTGGGSVNHNMGLDFSAVRNGGTNRLTLAQIRSSRENLLNCCGGEPLPLTLLPTLVSAYVAATLDQLYLPETLYNFDYCGSDWIGRLVTSSFYGSQGSGVDDVCAAFPEIMAGLQASQVIRTPVVDGRQNQLAGATCLDPDGGLVIEITASGTRFGDAPLFAVLLDGVEIGRAAVDTAVDTTMAEADPIAVLSQPQTIRFTAQPERMPQKIQVDFLNDNWAGPDLSGDTDLWLQSVRVGPSLLAAADLGPVDAANPPGSVSGVWYRYSRNGGLAGALPPGFCG